jgi:hypothetical protein
MFENDNNELYEIASNVSIDATAGTASIKSHVDSYLLKEAEKGNFKYTVLVDSLVKRYMPVGTNVDTVLNNIKLDLETNHFSVTEDTYYEWDEMWFPANTGIELTLISQREEVFQVNSTYEDDIVATVDAIDPDGNGIIYSINEPSGLFHVTTDGIIKLTADGAVYVNDGHDLPTFTVDALSTSGNISNTATDGGSLVITPIGTIPE